VFEKVILFYFCGENSLFCYIYIYILIYKCAKQYGQGNLLENFPKKLSHLKENRFEIVKILGGFGGWICSFLLF
jgi:hypothetical protein